MSLLSKKAKAPKPPKAKSSFEKRKWIGLVCIVVALIISFVIVPLIAKAGGKTENIVIANENIKSGTVISKDMIKTEERGIYGLEGYVINAEDVIGKPAATDITQNDAITLNKIGKENITKIQSIVNNKHTLVTVSLKSNAAGVASHLKPGDTVKVAYALEGEYGECIIVKDANLANIEVYDIENNNAESINSSSSDAMSSSDTEKIAATVTLIAKNAAQEEALLKAEYNGDIHLIFVER